MNYKNLLTIILISISLTSFSQDYRYVNTIFSNVTASNNIIYGTAPAINSPYNDESNTTTSNLLMDIYQPTGDALSQRPVIIFAHGGGFSNGDKTVDDMTAYCDTFARKGYVTVSINYRQGVEINDNSDLHYLRAAYRGLQDGRSAIRFLRANAATYGIDTNKIYWGGNSAGSFIGLNSIYLDANEKPTEASAVNYTIMIAGIPANFSGPDLGNIDEGTNLNHNGVPNAVMACWGGVADTLTINANNNTPVFLVHGTTDAIVSFNSGAPFGISSLSPVYGSNSIYTRLNSIGIPAQETYFVPNQDHEFYGVTNGDWDNGTSGNQYWDTVITKATAFYYLQHKPTADFLFLTNNLSVDFTDASTGATNWLWNFGDGNTNTTQNPSHTYATSGTYFVSLYIQNDINSWDTINNSITVGTQSKINSNKINNDIKIYPNPTSNFVFIESNNQNIESIEVIDFTGKTILSTTNNKIDFIDYKKGIYFIKVITNKQIFTYEIVRE